MATPEYNFGQGKPLTDAQKKQAKVEAIKSTMGGITKAKEAEAEQLSKVPEQLKQAFGKQEGATKLGIQSQLAQQLAQQEGMGAGYNKAAARQQAAQAGLSTGMALGQIGVQSTKDVASATQAGLQAKTEAAGQLYEQLTGEQKLEKEFEEGKKAKQINLDTEISNKIAETKDWSGDDEDKALANLIDIYNQNKEWITSDPASAEKLAKNYAGIFKDVKGTKWENLPQDAKDMLTALGYSSEKFDSVEAYDY